MISHVIILSNFGHKLHLVRLVTTTQFCFQCTTHIRLITSLSYLFFVTNHTRTNQLGQLNFVLSIDCIYMISHVIVLSGFCHSVQLVTTIQFHSWHRLLLYNQSRHCSTGFCQRLLLIQMIMMVEFHFQCRLHLYSRSHCCLD